MDFFNFKLFWIADKSTLKSENIEIYCFSKKGYGLWFPYRKQKYRLMAFGFSLRRDRL